MMRMIAQAIVAGVLVLALSIWSTRAIDIYLSASGPMSKHPIGARRGLLTRPRSHRAMSPATRIRIIVSGWSAPFPQAAG